MIPLQVPNIVLTQSQACVPITFMPKHGGITGYTINLVAHYIFEVLASCITDGHMTETLFSF